MLTAYQASTGAYVTEYGELLCSGCFDDGDTFARPISNFGLDELQTEFAEGLVCSVGSDGKQVWLDGYKEPSGPTFPDCVPALRDENGHELVEEYHWGHGDGDE